MFTVDKALHFLFGFVISVVIGLLFASTSIGGLAGFGAGAVKEYYDSISGGSVELEDYVTTGLGSIAGVLVVDKILEYSGQEDHSIQDFFTNTP